VSVLEFDSEWFGCRIGRYDGDPAEADQWGKDNSVACVYTLLPLAQISAVHDAARRGFRLVDVRVEFAAKSQLIINEARYVKPEDGEAIKEIAYRSFQKTRFHNDRLFDRDRVNAMYANWALTSAGDTMLVDAENARAGFVVVGETHLELIAVDPSHRGAGYGRTLAAAALGHAHRHGRRELKVVTQGGNHAAQRTFQSVGFELVDTSLWLHKWYV
jgi:ribosomal protein S18 acetylase RimI-like enzyme